MVEQSQQSNTQANMQQPQSMPFYQNLSKALFTGEAEISFVDKILGRKDAEKLHILMEKEPLTKSDIESILFLMTSIDQKILNYNAWDRYVVVKLFPWVKDYSTACKTWMLYEEQFNDGKFDEDFTQTVETTGKDKSGKQITIEKKEVLEETKNLIGEAAKYMQHNFKFLVSVFLLISNTTLSLDGAAFETLTTSKFEYSYPSIPMPQPQQRNSLIGNMMGRSRR